MVGALIIAACGHDWDAFDPRGGDTGTGMAGPGGMGPGAGAAGGSSPGVGGGGQGGEGGTPATGEVLWGRALTDDADDTPPPAVAVDGSGNVFVAGTFEGELKLDGVVVLTSEGERDAYVLKLDPSGALLWGRRIGGAGEQRAYGVAVDSQGGAILTGTYRGELGFETMELDGSMDHDMFLVRMNAAGEFVCPWTVGGAGEQLGSAVAAHGNDAVVAGMFFNTIELGAGDLTSQGDRDLFVARLDAQCNEVWSRVAGSADADYAWSVAVSGAGRVFLGVDSPGVLNLGSGSPPAAGEDDAIVAAFGPDGAPLWTQRYGDADAQWAPRLSTDPSGNVIGAGSLWGRMSVGSTTLESAGGPDIYVFKLDPDGQPQWARRFGDAMDQHAFATATDATGAVLVVGGLSGEVDFGGGPLVSAGSRDLLVLKLDRDGNHVWSRHAGDANFQEGTSVAVDASGHVVVGGGFSGTMVLGQTLVSTSGADAFVARLAP
ncbi:uncharacterized protein CMC5_032460 [Chondromyces crocatus]|uniref:Uncharacterized protein n=1 Tax=Chondromyces crocatus TaxID=52 RepID=A0A0K1EE30_CHOCO|nr:uncharacterized protein CMC5_032460 [Chondromyces crocatus]